MIRSISIVGGGLAGLTLGILLRRQEIPVVIYEAGKYPRHKVCGEFLNGIGASLLDKMFLSSQTCPPRVYRGDRVEFFTTSNSFLKIRLPEASSVISRWDLDAWLAAEFLRLEGSLVTETRFRPLENAEGFVFATGRKANSLAGSSKYLGIKVHAKNVDLGGDLEMHFRKNGYLGLTQLEPGKVNLCGLFKLGLPIHDLKTRFREFLSGDPGSPLWTKLQRADWIENSFCTVGGLGFDAQRLPTSDLVLGDAAGMIPPFTGNGMSLAIETAFLAEPTIRSYAHGTMEWSACVDYYQRGLRKLISRRLKWACFIQNSIFRAARHPALFKMFQVPGLWRHLYRIFR